MKINWSEQSRDDLRDILNYVGSSFGGRKASEVLAEIRRTAELLENFPMLGKRFVEDEEEGVVYRTLPSKLNQIVYYIDGDAVTIVTIWQNRWDVKNLIKLLKKSSE